MSSAYWINADMEGKRRWHLAIDRGHEVYFPDLEFSEAMSIDQYQEAFPDNLVVPIGGPDEHSALLKIAEAYGDYLVVRVAEQFITAVGDAIGRPIGDNSR